MLFQCSVYFRQDALQIGPEKPLRCPKRPPTLPKVFPDAPKSPKRPPSSAQDVSTRLQATPTRPPKSPKRSPGASTEPPRGSCGAPRRPLHLQGDIDKEPVGGNGRKAFSIMNDHNKTKTTRKTRTNVNINRNCSAPNSIGRRQIRLPLQTICFLSFSLFVTPTALYKKTLP